MKRAVCVGLVSVVWIASAPVGDRLSPLAREDVRAPLEKAADFLVSMQNEDGSLGNGSPECLLELGFAPETYYAWQVASQSLACMALARCSPTPERERALERALAWLCETRIPTRGSDWDTDHTWSALYGFVALETLADDPRFSSPGWAARVRDRALGFYEVLERQQALSGGWAYYDNPPYLARPTWATSFCTALVLPALVSARDRGWKIADTVIDKALVYVRRCELPGGAYGYDLTPVPRLSGVEHINRIEGSLGRTQVCNWARVTCGDARVTPDVVRAGVDAFFRDRAFLDHVRTRPIPHEGFHANAGYFYFFAHYYVAKAIGLLPAEDRELLHARLRPHLVKTQYANGGTSDFLDSSYMLIASTSYFILTLEEGLAREPRTADGGGR